MTPKEKAEELVNKFSFFADTLHNGNRENAKQCALIAVDEILNTGALGSLLEEYYREVKQEIINLK
jgi:hypothetical protein